MDRACLRRESGLHWAVVLLLQNHLGHEAFGLFHIDAIFVFLFGEEPARSGWSWFQGARGHRLMVPPPGYKFIPRTERCLPVLQEAPPKTPNLELQRVHNTATKGQTISCAGCIASLESQASLSRDGLL